MAFPNYGLALGLEGAGSLSQGFTQGISNYLKMMNDMALTRSEIEKNNALTQSYGPDGWHQGGIDERYFKLIQDAAMNKNNPENQQGIYFGGGDPGQGQGQPMPQIPMQPPPGMGGPQLPPTQVTPQGGGGMPMGPMQPPGQPPMQQGSPPQMQMPGQPPSIPDWQSQIASLMGQGPQQGMLPMGQPGSQQAPQPSRFFQGSPRSPLAPLGSATGFDFKQLAATEGPRLQMAYDRLEQAKYDPHNQTAYQQKLISDQQKELWVQLKDLGTMTSGAQSDQLTGLTQGFNAERALGKGETDVNTFGDTVNSLRKAGIDFSPSLHNINAGLAPDQMSRLAEAAENGTLTPAQEKLIPEGAELAKDDQDNPVFVDKQGNLLATPEAGLGAMTKARIKNMTNLGDLRAGQLKYLQDIKTPEGSLTMKLMKDKLDIDPLTKSKISEEIEMLRTKNEKEPRLVESVISKNLADAGYLNERKGWVGFGGGERDLELQNTLHNRQITNATEMAKAAAILGAPDAPGGGKTITDSLGMTTTYPKEAVDAERSKMTLLQQDQEWINKQLSTQRLPQPGSSGGSGDGVFQGATGGGSGGAVTETPTVHNLASLIGKTAPNKPTWYCGQFVSNIYRSAGGDMSVTAAKNDQRLRVKPTADGAVPPWTVAWWPAPTDDGQHFALLNGNVNKPVVESTQEGAGKGQRLIRNDEMVPDISKRHGRSPVYFTLPPPSQGGGSKPSSPKKPSVAATSGPGWRVHTP